MAFGLTMPAPLAPAQQAAPEHLPQLWLQAMANLSQVLSEYRHKNFAQRLEAQAPAMLALIDRDSDLAVFQVMRGSSQTGSQYGVDHSIHTAISSYLVARRLGWRMETAQRAFKVALTMNLGMLELQGKLATQITPISANQRKAILEHPLQSVELLLAAGITDEAWLIAVAQHHELPGGKGYPRGIQEVCDLAALVQRADIYTAKLSPRLSRNAMAADRAGRTMFMSDPSHPITAALVKEFGVYPPGCLVKLQSGETAMVLRRGQSVVTPRVAVLTSARGTPLSTPMPLDTAVREHAVAGVASERTVPLRFTQSQLMALSSDFAELN